jgi:hypothetical protein
MIISRVNITAIYIACQYVLSLSDTTIWTEGIQRNNEHLKRWGNRTLPGSKDELFRKESISASGSKGKRA